MVDMNDEDNTVLFVDAIDDPVVASTSGAVVDELEVQRPANPLRVVCERPVDELDHGCSDLLG